MRKSVSPEKVGPSAWAIALLWAATGFTLASAVLLSGELSPFW